MTKARKTATLTGAAVLLATASLAGASTRAIDGFAFLPLAQASANSAIPSSTPGALLRPEEWDCNRIYPEYRAWLEAGNAPADWRHVGKTYRDVEDAELYDWNLWLEWAEDAGCGPLIYPSESAGLLTDVPTPALVVGGVVTTLGIVGLVAGSGGGTDSPG